VDRNAALVAVLGVAALLVVAAVAGGLVGGSVTTDVSHVEPPDFNADGAIYLEREEARSRILGFEFGRRYSIGVSFSVDAGCVESLGDDETWPSDAPLCDSSVEVEGTVALTGRSADGNDRVGVVFEVSRECFEAVEIGDPWPEVAALCNGD
jgi:hypothetical protein